MTDPKLEGMTLAQRLAQGPLEPEKALDSLEQLLASLGASHDLGLIHGSISPQKIVLTPDGRAALVGFPGRDPGAQPMARYAKGAAEPGYVAPEQVADDPVGRRTDLYSLGVVAYAMLTGKDPFGASEGVAADTIFYRILYKPSPRVPEAALAGLPASVGPAIDRAMVKEPQNRFTDARSFLQVLRTDTAVVSPVPVVSQRRSREPGSRKWMPYVLAGAVVVLLLVIGLGVAYAMGGLGGSPDTTIAIIETTTTASTEPATTTTIEVATTTSDDPSRTTTTATTTTTLPPSSTTLSTVSSTTTTAKPTTTTAKPTTTTTVKKTATVTVTDANKTYTGSVLRPSVTTSPAGLAVSYSSSPTNAGTYPITITVTSAGYTGSTTTSFTIAKANASISVSGWSGAYDTFAHGAHLNSATGVMSESLAGYVSLGASFTDVGTHYATWTFSHPNYVSDSRSVLIEITP
jgi:serine/threonine protein kinase